MLVMAAYALGATKGGEMVPIIRQADLDHTPLLRLFASS
jgi:hypothetical protein